MIRRRAIQLPIVLLIVVGVTLSTAWARQAWAESQAKSHADAAHSSAIAALSWGASVGLTSSELAPIAHRFAVVERYHPPSDNPFWGPKVIRFYDRQSFRFGRISTRVRQEVAKVASALRAAAKSNLQAAGDEVRLAQSLDVDPGNFQTVIAKQAGLLQSSTLPSQFRAISNALADSGVHLQASIAARQKYTADLIAHAGGTKAGVISFAGNEAQAEQTQMTLLGLLSPHAATLQTAIDHDLAAISAAPTALTAAVKESHLRSDLAALQAAYGKTVPTKMIVVSTENQSATMYEQGNQVYSTAVTTGGPELPTDHGVFHIYLKLTPFTFHSPWPEGSPYYYPPTPIQYWMPFDGAQGLHDASWRSNFGPGSNLAPTDLGTGQTILGTHGCVNLPFAAAQFVWDWAPVGTTVVVV